MSAFSRDRRNHGQRRSGKDFRSRSKPVETNLFPQESGEEVYQDTLKRDKFQDEINDGEVKIKIDVECSEDFARDVLDGLSSVIKKRNDQGSLEDVPLNKREQKGPRKLVSLYNNDYKSSSSPDLSSDSSVIPVLSQFRQKIYIVFLVSILAIATAVAGIMFLGYQKRKALELAKTQQLREHQRIYEDFLAHNLDNLLSRLDQLTANDKMARVFPEITSMPAIARFKRGTEPIEKAEAAIRFIYEVERIFDNWIDRANDFPPDARPGKEDIAYFSSVWRDMKPLLDRIESVKQDPSAMLNTLPENQSSGASPERS